MLVVALFYQNVRSSEVTVVLSGDSMAAGPKETRLRSLINLHKSSWNEACMLGSKEDVRISSVGIRTPDSASRPTVSITLI